MNKSLIISICICIIELFIILYLLLIPKEISTQKINTDESIQNEIIQDSIKIDDISNTNQQIQTKILYVKEQYTQDSLYIMSADDSALLRTFSEYIKNYNN
jgi:predicted PurR-regulated permease PerM